MKYTKYIYTVLFQLMLVAMVSGQAEDKSALNNGRPAGVTPKKVEKKDNPPRVTDTFRGGSDRDNSGNVGKGEQSEWTMPHDLDMLLDMIGDGGGSGPGDGDNSKEMAELRTQVEDLLLEQMTMKKQFETLLRQLEGCCDVRGPKGPNFSKKDGAYLFQSAPNPTVSDATVSFHIPESFATASIKFIDLSGKLVKTFSITDSGLNSVEIDGGEFSPGSYIYTLVVDGKAVESKVMNVAK